MTHRDEPAAVNDEEHVKRRKKRKDEKRGRFAVANPPRERSDKISIQRLRRIANRAARGDIAVGRGGVRFYTALPFEYVVVVVEVRARHLGGVKRFGERDKLVVERGNQLEKVGRVFF